MRLFTTSAFLALAINSRLRSCLAQSVHDKDLDVTYHGIYESGVETFLGIPYGEDTGGENRFRQPRPYVPSPGSTINAKSKGPACPQPYGAQFVPLYLSNITEISEDCLHLNVYRPEGTPCDAKLPVMLYVNTADTRLIPSNT
jgi:carboxylesterase type B